MQNNNTGVLATKFPVDVVPSAPRWSSWNIQTSAPNAAVSDSTLSASALSGITTLPVSRNNSPNVIAAIRPSTAGNRDVMASTLPRLVCAMPVRSVGRPAGPGTACSRSSWVCEATENSGAVLSTVRNALPCDTPVGAEGGPIGAPATYVPVGAETAETSGTLDNSAAYCPRSTEVRPLALGITTVTPVAELS